MEKIILAALLLCETGFFIFNIRKQIEKGIWAKRKFALQVLELLAFVLILLTPAVNLGLRFTLCLSILVLRVILSGIRYLISRKNSKRKSGIAKTANLFASLLILSMALVPSFIFADYNGLPVSGSHEVAETQYILIDQNREDPFEGQGSRREIPVHAFYPEDGSEQDAFPLVVFSHGAFGYYQSNMSSYQELASNGYVVLALDHPHHSFFTKNSSGKTVTVDPEFLNNVMYVNEIEDEEEIFRLSSEWVNVRIDDINAVLDAFAEAKQSGLIPDNWCTDSKAEADVLQVLAMADPENTGLYGHSLGGAASVTAGRNRETVKAVIDLDGTMLGEQLGYADGQYQYNEEPYPTPLLTIESELHYNERNKLGVLYANQYICDHAADARSVYFKGSAHMNFTDLPLFAPVIGSLLGTGTIDPESCIVQVNGIVLQYFDHYLKGKGELTLQEWYQ